jgi:hypothetical protein
MPSHHKVRMLAGILIAMMTPLAATAAPPVQAHRGWAGRACRNDWSFAVSVLGPLLPIGLRPWRPRSLTTV